MICPFQNKFLVKKNTATISLTLEKHSHGGATENA